MPVPKPGTIEYRQAEYEGAMSLLDELIETHLSGADVMGAVDQAVEALTGKKIAQLGPGVYERYMHLVLVKGMNDCIDAYVREVLERKLNK
jgi:hypothetical protein